MCGDGRSFVLAARAVRPMVVSMIFCMQECHVGRHMLLPSVRNKFDVKMSYRKDADVWTPYNLNVFKD
jgi:hypothetical protein